MSHSKMQKRSLLTSIPGLIDRLPGAAVLDTIIVASGIMTAVSLLFLSLFMHFGRDWNGR
jgi:hypothetical protein